MDATRLPELVDQLLTTAHSASSGRAAQTLYGSADNHLRQTVIALVAGSRMAEHESPGEASLQILRGHVTLSTANEKWEGVDGDLLGIPNERHGLLAQQDSAVLLTVVTS
ncbi:LuxR family transcriptional regulator [Gordonia sp. HNM0687]|uniref:LuxR family transcriptional regulator n=1 Tax=Gordonia mangrovi TaxID=2665643 RepID=A0A6L7GLT7_9ACTN|nr:LuxR family transcriptional regulator [Gordonia mangrovi]MXP20522.1 LuxR family transcriptional regulator [Gordonia mangrovi]UVF78885.1 LuxR family transcriptional regulator [Gordonia mangrovi]